MLNATAVQLPVSIHDGSVSHSHRNHALNILTLL